MATLSNIKEDIANTGYSNINQTVEMVSPEMAKRWLSLMIENQRNAVPSKITQYARAMIAGHWKISLPILFDANGNLFDGQHRLLAVVKSGLTIPFLVNWNMPDESKFCVDIGTNRTTTHLAKMSGLNARGIHTGVLNCCFFSPQTRGAIPCLSKNEQLDILKRHWDAIDFALKKAHTDRCVEYSAFLAPVARAYYTENRERLMEFLKVIHSGFSVSKNAEDDNAAIALRNLYFSETRNRKGASSGVRITDYRKATMALKNFLLRKPVKLVKETTVNHFPVAEFDKWWIDSEALK